ncbi:MAG TPA: ABC transporter permease [Rhodocyclaceae bacterium]|nr:ABC transporter permease [Rhodocyclaceae bacterium]
MRPTDLIALALAALAAHRLRSALTLLGIAVGIAAVILLTSIGEGIHRYVLAEFSQFGSNVIAIQPGKTRTGGVVSGLPTSARPLLPEDAQAIARLTDVVAVTPSVWGNAEVSGNGRLRRTTVYGVGPDMLRVFNGRLASGRFLPAEEVGSERALVVLGAKLERELFGSAGALGARLAIGNMQFRVIGVLAPKGQFLGIDLDDTAFIPASRALELFNRVGVNEIDVVFREGASASRVEAQLRDFMRARHGREDFTLVSQQEMLSTLSDILDVLTLAVGALGGISLLVGGVGIFTLMTIAVTERTSEIGLLVALGARRRSVLTLFLAEAVVLAGLGGVLGLGAGFGIAQLAHALLPALPVHTPVGFALLALAASAAIGLLAGLMPARRAARLDPVVALRAE